MKKFTAIALALTMALSLFAGCGAASTPATEATQPAVSVEGTMEELLNKVAEIQPAEFMSMTMPIDLTDTSEDGLFILKDNTGLDNADMITDAAVYGPAMGSIAFSMVMVRTAEGADVKTVAETMKAGIDPRKWICVEADDLQVVSYGDVVMLIMVASDSGMTSQSYVDAFAQVCGGELTAY